MSTKDEKEELKILRERLLVKGFPAETIIYSQDVDAKNFGMPKDFDKNLFDVVIYYKNEISELYVINPDKKKIRKIQKFSKSKDNKEILIFKVCINESEINRIELISDNAIKNLNEYINVISSNFSKTKYRRFYRGHPSIEYDLVPSIYRQSKRKKKKTGKKRKYVEFEDKMYMEALTYCIKDFTDENSDFENLVKMQHYEFPTRLLDLTMNSLVALFFAVRKSDLEDATDGEVFIFELNKEDIHNYNGKVVKRLSRIVRKRNTESLDSEYNNIICVIPRQNVDRLINQNGAFLLFGSKVNKTDISDKRIPFKRLIISKKYKKNILKQLSSCGINELELFPDLLSRLKYIKEHTMDFA